MFVSVLVNNHNYGRYLDSCIQSILRQTYRNVEVIVYDDGSTDQSLETLEEYREAVGPCHVEVNGKTVIFRASFAKATAGIEGWS